MNNDCAPDSDVVQIFRIILKDNRPIPALTDFINTDFQGLYSIFNKKAIYTLDFKEKSYGKSPRG